MEHSIIKYIENRALLFESWRSNDETSFFKEKVSLFGFLYFLWVVAAAFSAVISSCFSWGLELWTKLCPLLPVSLAESPSHPSLSRSLSLTLRNMLWEEASRSAATRSAPTSTVKKDLGSLPCLKVIGLFPTHGLTMYYGPSRKRQWWPLSSVWDKRVLSDLTETPHTSTGLFQLTRCC